VANAAVWTVFFNPSWWANEGVSSTEAVKKIALDGLTAMNDALKVINLHRET